MTGLQERFAHPQVTFTRRGELDIVELANSHGVARLTTFGATLLSYIPASGPATGDLIWVSDTAIWDGSKPVRGGVPVCWPWFGAYDAEALGADASDSNKKGHGIARYAVWDVIDVASEGDATVVVLELLPNAEIRQAWPLDFALRLRVRLGEKLEMQLIGENRSDRSWRVSEAFHTYLALADVEQTRVDGLEGTVCVDKLADGARTLQEGEVMVQAPMEQVFLGGGASLVVADGASGHRSVREIVIERENSASSVVWNPGPEGVKGFADMPDADYRRTACVEVANALDDAYWLAPGESHTMTMRLALR